MPDSFDCKICGDPRYTPPFDNEMSEETTPGYTSVTLDMPYARYQAGLPESHPLSTAVGLSRHYRIMNDMAAATGSSPPWATAAQLAHAVLDQQVLARAFQEKLPERGVALIENWPTVAKMRGKDGKPEMHVHAQLTIGGEALSKERIQEAIRHAAQNYDRLAEDIPASVVERLQTAVGRMTMRAGLAGERTR